MTTLHLGDCLNGCAECADRHHALQVPGEPCPQCGVFVEWERCLTCDTIYAPNGLLVCNDCRGWDASRCAGCGTLLGERWAYGTADDDSERLCERCYGGNIEW